MSAEGLREPPAGESLERGGGVSETHLETIEKTLPLPPRAQATYSCVSALSGAWSGAGRRLRH